MWRPQILTCSETGAQKQLNKLITFSVESPPTYILLNFKNLNLCPSQQDPNWALHLKMPPRWSNNGRASGSPAYFFAAALFGILQTGLFPSDSLRVKQQGLAIFYHLIILMSLGCLTFPPGSGRWPDATDFRLQFSAHSVQDRKVD